MNESNGNGQTTANGQPPKGAVKIYNEDKSDYHGYYVSRGVDVYDKNGQQIGVIEGELITIFSTGPRGEIRVYKKPDLSIDEVVSVITKNNGKDADSLRELLGGESTSRRFGPAAPRSGSHRGFR